MGAGLVHSSNACVGAHCKQRTAPVTGVPTRDSVEYVKLGSQPVSSPGFALAAVAVQKSLRSCEEVRGLLRGKLPFAANKLTFYIPAPCLLQCH